MHEYWLKTQFLSQNNGENPNVLVLSIKPSHLLDEEIKYRLDGQRVLIVSSDHPEADYANIVLDYPWLVNFEMVIEYSDRIFDAKAPVFGLVI